MSITRKECYCAVGTESITKFLVNFFFKSVPFQTKQRVQGPANSMKISVVFLGLRAKIELVSKIQVVTRASRVVLPVLTSKFPTKFIPQDVIRIPS